MPKGFTGYSAQKTRLYAYEEEFFCVNLQKNVEKMLWQLHSPSISHTDHKYFSSTRKQQWQIKLKREIA